LQIRGRPKCRSRADLRFLEGDEEEVKEVEDEEEYEDEEEDDEEEDEENRSKEASKPARKPRAPTLRQRAMASNFHACLMEP
jgi:hypothetical protein